FQKTLPDKPVGIERFVLECLSFTESHTGAALANTVHRVLCRFKIEHRAITLPFRVRRAQLESAIRDEEESDEECETNEPDEADPDDDGTAPSMMLEEVGDEDEPLPNIVSGSLEDDEYKRVTKALWKTSKEARRLRYNPGAKHAFKESCVLMDTPTPHNIKRDVITRWNSTELTLEDADRTWPGLTHYQQNSKYTPRKERFLAEDRAAIRGLLTVLRPLRLATETMSKAEVPLLADVIVQYDALNQRYGHMCNDKSLPLYLRHAADRAQGVLNKYYEKTDDSDMYRLALSRPVRTCTEM
ncbi:hypothetical protein FRC10_007895, partial [Ceratobasidium sp. 414]